MTITLNVQDKLSQRNNASHKDRTSEALITNLMLYLLSLPGGLKFLLFPKMLKVHSSHFKMLNLIKYLLK